jgi:hypothetical protein
MFHPNYIFLAASILPLIVSGFQWGDRDHTKPTTSLLSKASSSVGMVDRRDALFGVGSAALAVLVGDPQRSNAVQEQKFYSSNARNMARLSSGDKSGGSVYDNDPASPGAAKRRALQGCKISSSRNLAAEGAGIRNLSERDCNLRVLDGDTEFMLKAMRELACPTCPFGIDGA